MPFPSIIHCEAGDAFPQHHPPPLRSPNVPPPALSFDPEHMQVGTLYWGSTSRPARTRGAAIKLTLFRGLIGLPLALALPVLTIKAQVAALCGPVHVFACH